MSFINKSELNGIDSNSTRARTTMTTLFRSSSRTQSVTTVRSERRVLRSSSMTRFQQPNPSYFTRNTLRSSEHGQPSVSGIQGDWNGPCGLPNSGYTVAPNDARPSGIVNSHNFTQRPAAPSPTPQSTIIKLEQYDLSKQACVAIFHHEFKNYPNLFRPGSEQDLNLIKSFFQGHNAKLKYICEDFKVKDVRATMSKIRKKNFKNYSCLIVIIMSHGKLKDQISALDKCYNLEEDIVIPTRENPTLKGKPKLFIVQACKGVAMMEADVEPIETAPNAMDILKCFSTYEGTLAFRDPNKGSFFIQTLFKLLADHQDKEISEVMMLMRTEFSMKGYRQAPTNATTLMKKFFFRDLKKN